MDSEMRRDATYLTRRAWGLPREITTLSSSKDRMDI